MATLLPAPLPLPANAMPAQARPFDVIQVDPAVPDFGGVLMLVLTSNERLVRGVLYVPRADSKPRSEHCNVRHGEYAIIGQARWTPPG